MQTHAKLLTRSLRVFTPAAMMIAVLVVLFSGHSSAAPPTQVPPPANIVMDEGGVRTIVGSASFTDVQSVEEPVVLLIDATHLLTGEDEAWVPVSGQIMGRFDNDSLTAPLSYTIPLPIAPLNLAGDMDDDPASRDLSVYQLVVGQNIAGSPYLQFLEQRDGLSSLQLDPYTGDVIAGSLLLYTDGAREAEPTFPAAAGEDGRFFTDDDPLISLPVGYTLAILDDAAVTFMRAETVEMKVTPPAADGSADFSTLGLVESFDALIDHLSDHYAYTDLYQLDWQSLREIHRPAVEAAAEKISEGQADAAADATSEGASEGQNVDADAAGEVEDSQGPGSPAAGDMGAFYLALRALAQEIGDPQVETVPGPNADAAAIDAYFDAQSRSQANLGLSVAELEDGRVIVTEVALRSPASEAGIQAGDELISVDGTPVDTAITEGFRSRLPSADAASRLLQVRNLLRFPPNTDVTLTLDGAGSDAVQEITLTSDQYPLRGAFSVAGQPAPAGYRFIDDVGYFTLPAFSRPAVSLAMLEDFLIQAKRRGSEGVIIDLRGNTGGQATMMYTMASYFFGADDPLALDALVSLRYSAADGEFRTEGGVSAPIYAPDERALFDGSVAVLVDDGCLGACESFAELLQRNQRAAIVGQYATAGSEGSVGQVSMPGGILFFYTNSRKTFAESDDLPIQGRGVAPDVRVPVVKETELAKFNGDDPVIDAALAYMDAIQLQPTPVTFDHVGVTSVGPRSWRYDESACQLRRSDGTGLTIIPQQGESISAAVTNFVSNQGGEATLLEKRVIDGRDWELYAGEFFGQAVRIAGTVESGDTLLVVLFITNRGQAESLDGQVLQPFIENFTIEEQDD